MVMVLVKYELNKGLQERDTWLVFSVKVLHRKVFSCGLQPMFEFNHL